MRYAFIPLSNELLPGKKYSPGLAERESGLLLEGHQHGNACKEHDPLAQGNK